MKDIRFEAEEHEIGEHYVTRLHIIEPDMAKFTLEDIDGHLYLHMEVYNFSPSVLKYLRSVWPLMVYEIWAQGYDVMYSYNVNTKFLKLVTQEDWEVAGETEVLAPGNPATKITVYKLDVGEPEWVSEH